MKKKIICEIKKKFPKKGIKKISKELDVPKTCLMEWIKQIDFLLETISAGKKYRLEGAGRNPTTLNI